MRKFVAILSIFLILMSCQSDRPQEVGKAGRYQLSIPGYLKAVEDLDAKASLQYANYQKELYFTLMEIPKKGVAQTLAQSNIKTTAIPSLETYSKFISSTFRYTVNADTIALERLGALYWLEFEGEASKVQLYYQVAFAEDETHFYQLIFWTTAKYRSTYQEIMKKIMESFELDTKSG